MDSTGLIGVARSRLTGAFALCLVWAGACSVDRHDGGGVPDGGAAGASAQGGHAGTSGGKSGSAGAATGGHAGAAALGGQSATGGVTTDAGAAGDIGADGGVGANGGGGSGGTSGSANAGTGGTLSGGAPAAGGTLSGGAPANGGKGGTANGGTANGGKGGSASGGSASGGKSSGGTPGSGGAGDTTPPSVVSITPTNLASGVTSNSTVKITFSEAMNAASVASALQLTSFTAANLTLSWDSAGRVLTITPSGGFQYATGSSAASTSARQYTVTLSTAAKDTAGNSLPAFSSSFTTLRRINQSVSPESVGCYSDYGHAVGDGPLMCPSTTPMLSKWSSIASSGTYYIFITFNTSPLGSPTDITNVESATLSGAQDAPNEDFYSAHAVLATKLAYQAIDKTVLDAAVTDSLGTFASSAVTNPSVSVLASFKPDIASGNQHQLYRLEPTGSADSTVAFFTCSGFSLNVTFLSP